MGKDLCIFSRHNLDTSTIKNLAIDLANRLNVNIVYGFVDDYNFWRFDTSKYKYGFNIEGDIKVNDSEIFVSLTVDDYLPKKLYQEFGDDIFNCEQIWKDFYVEFPLNEESKNKFVKDWSNKVVFQFDFNMMDDDYSLDYTCLSFPENDLTSITINKDYLNFRLEFLATWNGITYMVNEEYEDGKSRLNDYRQRHRDFARIFGEVEKCYYTSMGVYNYECEFFAELENKLMASENEPIYTFSELFTNEKSFSEFQKNINNGIFPDVYIDDFKDLEKNTQF